MLFEEYEIYDSIYHLLFDMDSLRNCYDSTRNLQIDGLSQCVRILHNYISTGDMLMMLSAPFELED